MAEADANYVRILQLQYPDMPMSLRTIRRWDETRRKSGRLPWWTAGDGMGTTPKR